MYQGVRVNEKFQKICLQKIASAETANEAKGSLYGPGISRNHVFKVAFNDISRATQLIAFRF